MSTLWSFLAATHFYMWDIGSYWIALYFTFNSLATVGLGKANRLEGKVNTIILSAVLLSIRVHSAQSMLSLYAFGVRVNVCVEGVNRSIIFRL